MKLVFCISFLLLVIPALHALPTENLPTGTPTDKQCDLDLQVSNENEIRGVFETDDVVIAFHAIKQDDEIQATTTTVNPSVADSTITVHLSLPDINGRVVPIIEKLIVQHAVELVDSTNCQIPTNLNALHEELADKLYQCTKEMGMSQLRFSIMYLETVVASAQRICNGAESICTASPKYIYGEALFMCEEDLAELYPELTSSDTESTQEEELLEGEKDRKAKRWSWPSGSDHGCCGNYEGPCFYWHVYCYIHDRACSRCQYWHCGPACRPDN